MGIRGVYGRFIGHGSFSFDFRKSYGFLDFKWVDMRNSEKN